MAPMGDGLREHGTLRYRIIHKEENMEELLEILGDLHPEVDFGTAKDLVTGGILDSFDIVTLISEINEAYDVTISAAELTPENFASAETIYALIKAKLDDED